MGRDREKRTWPLFSYALSKFTVSGSCRLIPTQNFNWRKIYFMCTTVLTVGMHTAYMPGVHGGQKRPSEPLKLELKTIVICCGCWEEQGLYKSSKCSKPLEPSPRPPKLVFFFFFLPNIMPPNDTSTVKKRDWAYPEMINLSRDPREEDYTS